MKGKGEGEGKGRGEGEEEGRGEEEGKGRGKGEGGGRGEGMGEGEGEGMGEGVQLHGVPQLPGKEAGQQVGHGQQKEIPLKSKAIACKILKSLKI